MKITPEQEALMRSMCMERKSNKEIADAVGIHVTKVHAWRSRNNLTRAKVENIRNEQQKQDLLNYCDVVNQDKALRAVLDSCEWQLEKVVSYIVDALEADNLCNHCSSRNTPNGEDCNLRVCGAAVIKRIKANVGEKS